MTPQEYFYSLINKKPGQPADDYKQVLQKLVDQGVPVNYRANERGSYNDPFHGLKVVKDASGAIRGTVQFPATSGDANNFFTHEFLVIADKDPGQPPFVGPFVWAWIDRGGGPISWDYGDDTGDGDGDGGDGGTDNNDLQAQIDQLKDQMKAMADHIEGLEQSAVLYGQKVALQMDKGQFVCAEGGGPDKSHQNLWLTSRQSVGSWESLKVMKGQ